MSEIVNIFGDSYADVIKAKKEVSCGQNREEIAIPDNGSNESGGRSIYKESGLESSVGSKEGEGSGASEVESDSSSAGNEEGTTTLETEGTEKEEARTVKPLEGTYTLALRLYIPGEDIAYVNDATAVQNGLRGAPLQFARGDKIVYARPAFGPLQGNT